MPTPRRRLLFLRVLAAVIASSALVFATVLPAQAAPQVSEVSGGDGVSTITEYQGLLYLGSEAGLQSFDGTTFTAIGTVPTGPESPRDFVEYAGDLWMVGGPLSGPTSLWRFDGTTLAEFEPEADHPVVVGGRLYFRSFVSLVGELLAWTDGVTTTVEPLSPIDVGEIALLPNGDVTFTEGPLRTLWTFDGTTFAPVVDPAAPVNVFELQNLSAALVFEGQAADGDPDAAYTWDGTTFARLGAGAGAATDVGCFLENAGTLYYLGDDGTSRMFSATPSVAASEVPVTPTVPGGCPRYIASDGTFYLQAQGTPGSDPTLHTWNGTTVTQLDSVDHFPTGFLEYGGKIYFTAQPVSESSALFVLEDVAPAVPTGGLLPPTGAVVSWWLIPVGALLVAGGAGILVDRARRRRVPPVPGAQH